MPRFILIARSIYFAIAVIYTWLGAILLDPILIGCALAILLILRRSERQSG